MSMIISVGGENEANLRKYMNVLDDFFNEQAIKTKKIYKDEKNRIGIGKVMFEEIPDFASPITVSDFAEKEYQILVEIMIRFAQYYYDQISCLMPELDGKENVVIWEKGIETTLIYLLHNINELYPQSYSQLSTWVNEVANYFSEKSHLFIYVTEDEKCQSIIEKYLPNSNILVLNPCNPLPSNLLTLMSELEKKEKDYV